ncbi:hypothetical protein CJP74_03120 [Psittacicella melopsittaci]|uniref:D-alanine--D-alanine ligase n=1 Tax=Psittacicella melopsittaci TaxID=2028576 RepID=A0A3A1Y6Q0_9GAMM|nr:D-alanine--D-alanine ligase [Psittacicella melopsittaci]RIY32986.1 hypothetical protein CJP74_03120 [Psittacicella melopsittaci]
MKTNKYTVEDLKQYKIAVLCGGTSNEREISLLSGDGIYSALKASSLNLDVHKIDPKFYDLINLKKDGFNLVFNTLHGRFGEDGQVQGFLDVLGIKYSGCNLLQSALTLDKLLTKKVWLQSQVSTSAFINLTANQILEQQDTLDLDKIIADLGLPLFVKPNLEGSSIGISKVKSKEELLPALITAAKLDNQVLVEQFINGKEYSVPVLNNKALAAIEIIIDKKYEFYDYQSKYFDDNTRYECPANLSPEQTAKILALAEKATLAVGIKSWCRVDILSNQEGEFYALEINTNPGMTTHSLFPMAAKYRGMDYTKLCLHVLVDAINDVELG